MKTEQLLEKYMNDVNAHLQILERLLLMSIFKNFPLVYRSTWREDSQRVVRQYACLKRRRDFRRFHSSLLKEG